MQDPEEVKAAAEAAEEAQKAAAVPKEEIQAAVVKAMTPSSDDLKLADRESRGDFSHLEAEWEKRDNSSLKFEDDDDDDEDEDEDEDEDDDDDDDDDE